MLVRQIAVLIHRFVVVGGGVVGVAAVAAASYRRELSRPELQLQEISHSPSRLNLLLSNTALCLPPGMSMKPMAIAMVGTYGYLCGVPIVFVF
jgi:hypothetical protein